jgi:hypothetical protein
MSKKPRERAILRELLLLGNHAGPADVLSHVVSSNTLRPIPNNQVRTLESS